MYKEILRSIAGIEIFPVISLLVFVTLFTGVITWTVRLDRRRLSHLANLPLDTAADAATSQATQLEDGR